MNHTITWIKYPFQKPPEWGWYLVAVKEVNDLGISSWIQTDYFGPRHPEGQEAYDTFSAGYDRGLRVTHWSHIPPIPRD